MIGRCLTGLVGLLLFATAVAGDAPGHVVMISIDGMRPSSYTTPGPARIPTLRRLAGGGAFATGVVGVIPTVTYPSHTTMITGVPPAVHGIVDNRILDPENLSQAAWYWYARQIQVPTLPGAVRARGLTAGAVSWPVSIDLGVDYLLPEYWRSQHPESLNLLRALAKPAHLVDAFDVRGGDPFAWPPTDVDRTALAAWILETYQPTLLLLHIFDHDTAAHAHGPDSPEALAALEAADGHVATMLGAIERAGLGPRTDVVIVSDHGFLEVERQLQLNALFKDERLLTVDDRGRVTDWQAYFQASGGSGFVFLKNPADTALRDRVGQLLEKVAADPANGVHAVWTAADLAAAGAMPDAAFGVDMKAGFYASAAHTALIGTPGSRAGHGFGPTRPEMHASLIFNGPHAPGKGSLGVVRMTQIAPTIASWLDLGLSPKADKAIGWRN